jgi:hypothetical protein
MPDQVQPFILAHDSGLAEVCMAGVRVVKQILAAMVTLGLCMVTTAMSTRDNFWHAGSKDKWVRLIRGCEVRSILFN